MSPFAPRKDFSFLMDLSRSERRQWATDLGLRDFHNVAFRSAKGFLLSDGPFAERKATMGDRPAAGKRSMAEWSWDGLAIRPTLNLPLTVAYSGLHAACARGPTLTRSASEVEPPLPSLALREYGGVAAVVCAAHE